MKLVIGAGPYPRTSTNAELWHQEFKLSLKLMTAEPSHPRVLHKPTLRNLEANKICTAIQILGGSERARVVTLRGASPLLDTPTFVSSLSKTRRSNVDRTQELD